MRGRRAQDDGPGTPADDALDSTARLRRFVRASALPMTLVELPHGRTVEFSQAFLHFVGRDRETCLSMHAEDYTEDPDAVRASLGLLSAGTVDAYTRSARMHRPDGQVLSFGLRAVACAERGPRPHAVVTVLPHDWQSGRAEDLPQGPEPGPPVLGTVDAQGRIDRVGSDDAGLLPHSPQDMVGRSLLAGIHPEDTGRVLVLAATSSARSATVTGGVRLRTRRQGSVGARIALQPLAAPGAEDAGFAFALQHTGAILAERPAEADAELAAALDRSDHEIRLVGVASWLAGLPSLEQLPQLGELTGREHEIVVRLVGGQRVRAIAREMFLSESTVRNHLTAVYRKLGVASQGELLDRLRA